MLLSYTRAYLEEAEEVAANTGDVEKILAVLRKLGLDDYGLFLISLPNSQYPAISKLLPRMASEEVSTSWTGSHGTELLKQTLAFTRILENSVVRYMNRTLHDCTVLDFGCGYGRFMRMMYYYISPENLWGVDAWDRSLQTSRDAGILGNLVQSERTPKELPVAETTFDVAFAFSVFTHLAPPTAQACLGAVRRHMNEGGLFIPTIRPLEFWSFIDGIRQTNHASRLEVEHNSRGIAYLPHEGEEGKTYGDTSMGFDFLATDEWRFLGYDRSIYDPYQISVILQAR